MDGRGRMMEGRCIAWSLELGLDWRFFLWVLYRYMLCYRFVYVYVFVGMRWVGIGSRST
jgi:hypothetical protein